MTGEDESVQCAGHAPSPDSCRPPPSVPTELSPSAPPLFPPPLPTSCAAGGSRVGPTVVVYTLAATAASSTASRDAIMARSTAGNRRRFPGTGSSNPLDMSIPSFCRVPSSSRYLVIRWHQVPRSCFPTSAMGCTIARTQHLFQWKAAATDRAQRRDNKPRARRSGRWLARVVPRIGPRCQILPFPRGNWWIRADSQPLSDP